MVALSSFWSLVLFVNVASRCGFTHQCDGLQALWKTSTKTGGPRTGGHGKPAEIASFCRANFGVDFPMLENRTSESSKPAT